MPENQPLLHQLGVVFELLIEDRHRRRARIVGAHGRFVGQVNQRTGLLKLDREEESGARVDALDLDTLRVGATRSNAAGPEVEAGSIGLATQEIEIVLTDKEVCIVHGITLRWKEVVILDCYCAARGERELGARRAAQTAPPAR